MLNAYKVRQIGENVYYYAFLDENDICTAIYEMPAQISGDQFIQIPSNYPYLVGQHFNRETGEFEVYYYYAVLNEKSIVTDTVYYSTQQEESVTLRAITYAQYKEVKGLYWNGTEYVAPPISIAAVASTDEVNYKNQDKWLSTKLDEMDTSIAGNTAGLTTVAGNLETVASSLATVTQNLSALSTTVDGKANAVHTHDVSDVTGLVITLDGLSADINDLEEAVDGKANTSHTHTAADLSGVVKTVNGNAPDASGNITVTSGGMTADEILTAVKTVDGAGSGLDADMLDGIHASGFAVANHNHDVAYAPVGHTHAQYLTEDDIDLSGYATTTAMNAALAGKSDTTHNHDGVYAAANHTHAGYATREELDEYALVESLEDYATTAAVNTALSGKANATHNHDAVYAPISHAHTMANVTGLEAALAGKSDSTHNHDTAYAAINHTHTGYATTASMTALETTVSNLENDIAGKAEASHTHSQSDVTGLTAALNGKANTSHTHAQSNITGLTAALNGKANTSHTHAISNVTGLQTALDGKAASSHTHTISNVTGLQSALDDKAASSHTHSDYLPTAGGTLNGNLNVNGIVRVNSQQCLFDSGTMVTLSTNNRETMIAGSKIYSKVQIAVSSDERLKENVKEAPKKKLANLVQNLDVKTFNYIGSDEENIGVIAQKLINVCPELAKYFVRRDENGYYSVKTADLVFPLIAAVQELYKEVHKK